MPNSLEITLKNDSPSPTLFAYVTGLALQHDNRRCLLRSNGRDLYFPTSPPSIGSPLAEDCAIPLGAPGHTTGITVPQLAGARIWISEGPLTFLLNPGPALVEPSVLNPSDPNAEVDFAFCEFTLNDAQLYANVSYVDFVPRIPVALTLQQNSGELQTVAGMAAGGIEGLAEGLVAQARRDGRPWDRLVVRSRGRVLRVLNATHGGAVGAGFEGYFEPFVEEVWRKYGTGARLRINTQAAAGVLEGMVNGRGEMVIGDEVFQKPTTTDILGCNSGPFTTGPSPTRNAIIPRLAAAFVRSTLLSTEDQPSLPHTFYRQEPTNHYARLVHEHNLDGKGYAFAYDDVQPDGGDDQSGKVNAGDPVLFTVTVGGGNATRGVGGGVIPGPTRRQAYERGPPPPPPQQDGYDRPPPPPPSGTSAEPHEEGRFRDKLRGFADRILR